MNRKDQLRQLLSATTSLLRAMQFSISSVTNDDYANVGKYSSYKVFLRKYNDIRSRAVPLLADPSMVEAIVMEKVREPNDLTWPQQKGMFDIAFSSLALLKASLETEIGYAEDEAHKLKDFIESNLRKAILKTPEKEKEVQDAIEVMLIGRGMAKGTDYDRETGRVKTAGKESIPDFIFPILGLCSEVKLSSSTDKLRAIVDEINADIRAYATVYERQLYVVYDLGTIRDAAEFKRGLEDKIGVSVIVVKH
jgi:hypothetical protein